MLSGANSETQWYCAPAMGDIDDISAIYTSQLIIRLAQIS